MEALPACCGGRLRVATLHFSFLQPRGYAVLEAVRHPGRIVPVLFSVFLTVGTILLCLPISRTNSDEAPNVLAAAATLGANRWQAFRHVLLPMCSPRRSQQCRPRVSPA